MPKKIITFALSKEAVEQIEKTSKALGMNRSELIEFLVKKGFHFSEDVKNNLNEISKLQEEAREKIRKRRY